MNVTCPDCNGDKQRVGLFPKYRDDVPHADRKPVIFFDCQRCKGAGEVPDEMFQWIEAGKRLKADRQKGGMALREFCVANGIDPLTRSHRECGYIDPSTPDVPFEWPQQSVA